MDAFYYLNYIFCIFGFKSRYKKFANANKVIKTVFAILFVYNISISSFVFVVFEDLFGIAWFVNVIVTIVAYVIYCKNHSKIYSLLNKIHSLTPYDNRSAKLLSVILTVIWFTFTSLILTLSYYWSFMFVDFIKQRLRVKVSERLSGDSFAYLIIITMSAINSFGIIGVTMFHYFIYLYSYYILFCFERVHYKKLKQIVTIKVLPHKFDQLCRLRREEMTLNCYINKLNSYVGFIPVLYISELFLRLCGVIIRLSINRGDMQIGFYLSDIITFSVGLVIIIIIVDYMCNKYNVHKIAKLIDECETNDCKLKLEMNLYLQQISLRFTHKPKACGLFYVNGMTILTFISSVVTFAVMFVQLNVPAKINNL